MFRIANFPANGEKDGHKITVGSNPAAPKGSWVLDATPAPGATGLEGAQCLVFYLGGVPAHKIEFAPLPGAAERQAVIFAKVRIRAAEAFYQLASLLPYIEQDNLYREAVRYVSDPGVIQSSLRPFQRADGLVSLSSIDEAFHTGGVNATMMDGSVRMISYSLWEGIKNDLQLGVYGEDWRSIGGIVPSIQQVDFFSYGSLSTVTSQVPAVQEKVRELESLLGQAEAAAARSDRAGEQSAMKAYLDAVAAGGASRPASRRASLDFDGAGRVTVLEIQEATPHSGSVSRFLAGDRRQRMRVRRVGIPTTLQTVGDHVRRRRLALKLLPVALPNCSVSPGRASGTGRLAIRCRTWGTCRLSSN